MSNQAAESQATSRPASTQDDWEEVKKDVKQLVQALRSLAPKPEADEPQRQFDCDREEWLKWIRPTPERLEKFSRLLSLMFIDDDTETLLRRNEFCSGLPPSFAYNLTLRFVTDSGPQDISLRNRCPHISVAQVREYIMGLGLGPNAIDSDQVNETSNAWSWQVDAMIYYVFGSNHKEVDQYKKFLHNS
ncbi:hypothetical protein F4860DRAFT_497497 [Xylaria cubensis]|nr:hypothetical protein F4860DRAFT_497497 [Xylaria cubensis]